MSALQIVRVKNFFAEVPEKDKEAAYATALDACLELMGKPPMSPSDYPVAGPIEELAKFFTPGSSINPVHANCRSVLDEVLLNYVPKVRPDPAPPAQHIHNIQGSTTVQFPTTPMHLETAQSRREELKYLWLGDDSQGVNSKRVRVPRESEPPFNLCYPHTWMALLAAGSTPAAVHALWKAELNALIIHGSLHEMLMPRFTRLQKSFLCWFSSVPQNALPTTIPYSMVEAYQLQVENLLELYLISASSKILTTPTAATHHFNTTVAGLWQSREPIDYWPVVQAAKTAKPLEKNFLPGTKGNTKGIT